MTGTGYDNRDGGMTLLLISQVSGLLAGGVQQKEEVHTRGMGFCSPHRFFAITLAIRATAGALPCTTAPRPHRLFSAALVNRPLFAIHEENLYVIPEHRDHDPASTATTLRRLLRSTPLFVGSAGLVSDPTSRSCGRLCPDARRFFTCGESPSAEGRVLFDATVSDALPVRTAASARRK